MKKKISKRHKYMIKLLHIVNDDINKVLEHFPELTKEEIWKVIYEKRRD